MSQPVRPPITASAANTPAVPQASIPELAAFYAASQHQAALAQTPNGPKPQAPTRQQAIDNFMKLQPQHQRQIHANFIARQRIAAQHAQASPQRPPSAQAVYHPALAAAQRRPPPPSLPQTSAAAVRQRPEAPWKRVRVEAGYDRRRDDSGMRGSMRGEIARLMFASGDVPEPDVDTVDYMEDLVVEFLADLCRPAPPIRPTPSSQAQPIALNADILRHRLASHSYLRKYLRRWDDMTYLAVDLQQSKRIAQPSHGDLIEAVGKKFLGLDEDEAAAGAKRQRIEEGGEAKKRGRPPKNPEERKKPGPKKGWKKNTDPSVPKKRAPVTKKKKAERIGSAAPSPSKP